MGVNKFSENEPTKQELLRIDDKVEIQQRQALKKLRSTRDNKKVDQTLSKLQSVVETDENLMPYILDSVKAYATTGEISNKFREVFGEYKPKEVF